MLRVSVDIGGTFTDMVVTDEDGGVSAFKSLSTHGELGRGVMDCMRKAATERGVTLAQMLDQVDSIIHGTTATTNALLTRTGAKTGILTTEGFRDIIELRRGIRVGHSPYNLKVPFPAPLVSRDRIIGVSERVRYDGKVITRLDESAVADAASKFTKMGVEAIAVCFLFSHINPDHEALAAAILRERLPDVYVTASSEILPASREFERFNTTVVGAYGGPVFASYIDRLEENLRDSGFKGKLVLIQSNGGIQNIEAAKKNPVSTLLSGPAAGPAAGIFLSGDYSNNLISVDMGGTSFEVAIVRDRETLLTTETWLSDQRLAVKLVDVHSIGAGGGSIAWIDPLGLLRVGPQSAGSNPGPACYGKGGTSATVTDANVALGYVDPRYFLGGEISLDAEASQTAIAVSVAKPLGIDVDEAAFAIFDVVNESMADALNERCTKRGFDPREFMLISAGGAGGLHAATIARKAKIGRVMIPRFASTYCAFGMQLPDYSHDYVRSYAARVSDADFAHIEALFEEMEAEGKAALSNAGITEDKMVFERSLDMRYLGQFHEVDVRTSGEKLSSNDLNMLTEAFHDRHKERYAFALPDRAVEIVYLRLRAIGRTAKIRMNEKPAPEVTGSIKGRRRAYFGKEHGWRDIEVHDSARLSPEHVIAGPAIVEDPTTTILIPIGFVCEPDRLGNLLLSQTN